MDISFDPGGYRMTLYQKKVSYDCATSGQYAKSGDFLDVLIDKEEKMLESRTAGDNGTLKYGSPSLN